MAHDKGKSKSIKVRKYFESLTIGRDFTLKKLESLSNHAVVGRLEYVKMNRLEMIDWVTTNWKPLFDYVPQVGFHEDGFVLFF